MEIKTLEQINLEFARENQINGIDNAKQRQDKLFPNFPADFSLNLTEVSEQYPNEVPTDLVPLPENLTDGLQQEATQNSTTERSFLRELGSLAIKVAIIVGAVLLVFTFVYGLHYSIEPGMSPTVKDGDLVMFYRWDKDYKAGDLILLTFQGKKQVRRVIASAGDKVDITEEGLFINGELQQEPEITRKTIRYDEGIEFPVTLGKNEVFVLGDARESATDSRIYGSVNVKDIHGKVITVLKRRSL
jgi:signal peptidase I